MPRVFLLIDGYNLLHAAGFGRRRFAKGGLELARNRLLQKLADNLPQSLSHDTVVIFDSGRHAEDSRTDTTSPHTREPRWPFSVTYSAQGQSADDDIETRLASHSSPRQIVVVSGDHRLHKAASRRGARAIDSDQFLSDLESSPTKLLKSLNTQKPGIRSPLSRENSGTASCPPLTQAAADKRHIPPEQMAQLNEHLLEMDLSDLLKLDLPRWTPPKAKAPRNKRK